MIVLFSIFGTIQIEFESSTVIIQSSTLSIQFVHLFVWVCVCVRATALHIHSFDSIRSKWQQEIGVNASYLSGKRTRARSHMKPLEESNSVEWVLVLASLYSFLFFFFWNMFFNLHSTVSSRHSLTHWLRAVKWWIIGKLRLD